jgi:hypothetical protein
VSISLLASALAAFPPAYACWYFYVQEKKVRGFWQARSTLRRLNARQNYRESALLHEERRVRAPVGVRLAALSAFLLGSFLPAALLVSDLSALGTGLMALAGTLVAAKLTRSARPLLSGKLDGAIQACRDARTSLSVNSFVVMFCAALASFFWLGDEPEDWSVLTSLAAPATYSLLSLLQALLLSHAALRVAREHGSVGASLANEVIPVPLLALFHVTSAVTARRVADVKIRFVEELRVEQTTETAPALGVEISPQEPDLITETAPSSG